MIRLRTRVWKFTDDDWYGNYRLTEATEGNKNRTKLVQVSLLTLSNQETRVCVWGNDDFGMELDFKSAKKATAMFMLVIAQEVVNQRWLEDNGFVRA